VPLRGAKTSDQVSHGKLCAQNAWVKLPHYHRRSNVETVFAMIKAKFGIRTCGGAGRRSPDRPAGRVPGIAHGRAVGQWLSARVCPHCGHPPNDFVDEETVVE